MDQLVRVRTEHQAPKIINLIGPTVIVALAATLFMSDYSFKSTLGDHFRVSPSLIDPSLQTSMAEGFFTLIGGTAIFIWSLMTWQYVMIIIATLATCIGTGLILYRKYGKTRALSIIRKAQIINLRVFVGSLSALGIVLGAISGESAAKNSTLAIDASISSGCHGCSVFRTSSGDYAGVAILADKQRIVLAQVHGVRLIKVDDLLAIIRSH